MTADEYQIAALRTAAFSPSLLQESVLGLCGESGECADIVKKHCFQGHELDKLHLAEELGDVAWYLAIAAFAIGYDLEDVFNMNIEKLRDRYPNGFEPEKSVHRKKGDV